MDNNETVKNVKSLLPAVVYAVLTWIWFYLNDNNDLPIIGHTELVLGSINSNADKMALLFDMIYFAISVAVMLVLTEVILSQINLPLIKIKEDDIIEAAGTVNFVVLLYEFFVLEFRLRLIGLTVCLIICFFIGTVIAQKVMKVLRPILNIADAVETISDLTNINNHDDKK